MFAVRRVAASAPAFARRSISSSVVRKDLIQDLYIKELKAYKTPEVDKAAQLQAVKSFTPPAAPSAPASLTTDLAADLETYDATTVDLAAKPKSTDRYPRVAFRSLDGF
ncbi:ATPase, F0 complex, subunit H [Phaffia rhodozyma]|uniref:ATPase, F0 complex, subunit H n=1 Tax=Phaffia rhodozyma TaxID=264483 RepID=A0A0F7SI26_PHARH|nr:ATPase, F0 complex, subunit H [Phaffia rhodozyma]